MKPLTAGRASCSHIPEPHVVYHAATGRYRAVVMCRCRQIEINAGRSWTSLSYADAAAQALMQLADAGRK